MAALFVSKPKSINSAPRETKPSGIFKAPDAIPAKELTNQLVSSVSLSSSKFFVSFGSFSLGGFKDSGKINFDLASGFLSFRLSGSVSSAMTKPL